jgi:hypothetical protein
MPTALYSFKIDSDGRVRVGHIFFAANDAEAEKLLKAHADACPKFGPAHKAGETIEIGVELDTLPEADEASLEEFLEIDDDDEEEDLTTEGAEDTEDDPEDD